MAGMTSGRCVCCSRYLLVDPEDGHCYRCGTGSCRGEHPPCDDWEETDEDWEEYTGPDPDELEDCRDEYETERYLKANDLW